MLWWMFSSVDLWLKIVMNFRPPSNSVAHRVKVIIYHSVAWSGPLILTASAAASGLLRGSGAMAFCGANDTDTNPQGTWTGRWRTDERRHASHVSLTSNDESR
jgi:hypothetical protein